MCKICLTMTLMLLGRAELEKKLLLKLGNIYSKTNNLKNLRLDDILMDNISELEKNSGKINIPSSIVRPLCHPTISQSNIRPQTAISQSTKYY